MVDIVKNTASRVEVRKTGSSAPQDVPASQSKLSVKAAGPSLVGKALDSHTAVKEMASAAPIDKENVNRIKDAIQRGEYPIDLDRVSDALMEAYREMKSYMEGIVDLVRIGEIIDALETRGSTASNFLDLCSELETLLDALPSKLIGVSVENYETKKRISSMINRLGKLEAFATAQSEITSKLQKYIADPDKLKK